MVNYKSMKNSDLNTLLTNVGKYDISSYRIVNIFHDGTDYVMVYEVP